MILIAIILATLAAGIGSVWLAALLMRAGLGGRPDGVGPQHLLSLAAGMALPATVAPFILRGVTLAGVDSVMRPRADRLVAWQRLTQDLSLDKLTLIGSQEVGLDEAIGLAARLLKGEVRGRVVVDVNR